MMLARVRHLVAMLCDPLKWERRTEGMNDIARDMYASVKGY